MTAKNPSPPREKELPAISPPAMPNIESIASQEAEMTRRKLEQIAEHSNKIHAALMSTQSRITQLWSEAQEQMSNPEKPDKSEET